MRYIIQCLNKQSSVTIDFSDIDLDTAIEKIKGITSTYEIVDIKQIKNINTNRYIGD